MSSTYLKKLSKTIRRPYNRWDAFRRLRKFHSKPRTIEETIACAMDLGSRGFYKITSIQKRSEILALAKAVEELKPATILEIGTARAGTLLIWSQIATDRVITCDLIEPGIRKELYEAFPPPASLCKIDVLSGDSHSQDFKALVKKALGGQKVDFMFLDGDHTEAGVRADYNDYKEFVRSGGIIAFHDIVKKQAIETNQVYYFWKELKKNSSIEEFIDDEDQCGYGIGILRVQ